MTGMYRVWTFIEAQHPASMSQPTSARKVEPDTVLAARFSPAVAGHRARSVLWTHPLSSISLRLNAD